MTTNYIMTPAKVEALAAKIMDAGNESAQGAFTYLQALVATTQRELKGKHNIKKADQVKAFENVAAEFYAAVVRVAKSTSPEPDRLGIARRTGFARSNASTLRGWLRAGNDIKTLVPGRVRKMELATHHKRRPASLLVLKRQCTRLVDRLAEIAKALEAADHQGAIDVLQPALSGLAGLLAANATPVRNMTRALAEHRPFRSGRQTVMAVDFGQRQAA